MKRNLIFLTLAVAGTLATFISTNRNTEPLVNEGMVKVTLLYPGGEGKTFDMDYYKNKHMPMVAELMGDAMKKFTIDEGISGRTPEDPIPYMAIGYLWFDKLEDYQNAIGPVIGQILADIPNYTNVQPVLQISKVIK